MGVDDDPTGDTVSSEYHDSAGDRQWWKRRRLWVLGAVVVAALIMVSAIAIPRTLRPSDPAEDGALPSNIAYGRTEWAPRGSLANDAEFIRDAAKRLPEDDDYVLLWAGRGADGADGESDFAFFVSPTENDNLVLELYLVRRYPDGDWGDDKPGLDTQQSSGSFSNAIMPLPLDAVEGLGGNADSFFLVRDDVYSSRVETLDGDRLDEHDDVISFDSDKTPYGAFGIAVRTFGGDAYTSPSLTEPLRADSWTRDQAETVLDYLPNIFAGGSTSLGDEGSLTHLGEPEMLEFDKGTGLGVTALDHGVKHYKGIDAPNPRRQRSALIIAAPGKYPIVSSPALDGGGSEAHPVEYADYAVAIPKGIPGGPAVAVSGGDTRLEPKLPVIGKPADKHGLTIFGKAPESTAVVFRDEGGSPRSTSLVVQHPEK